MTGKTFREKCLEIMDKEEKEEIDVHLTLEPIARTKDLNLTYFRGIINGVGEDYLELCVEERSPDGDAAPNYLKTIPFSQISHISRYLPEKKNN